MRLRNVLIATTTLVAGTIVGATTQHFASADVTSGDRPVLVPIDTCRIADTRPAPDNVGPISSPLGPAETITIDAQQAGTDCTGQIPASATALSLNVTALNATSNSFITIWPEGPLPTASALNPEPGTRVFNAVTTEVTASQTFQIYNNRGNVDVFVDINGYYDNHNHDDLYYTETEVEAVATPTFTEITYGGNGTLTVLAATPVPQKIRDLGSFQSTGGTVKTTWTSHIRMNDTGTRTCNFQIRVDGTTSRPTDGNGLTGTEAVIATPNISVPAVAVDVFAGLAAGTHTVELWARTSNAGSCFDNPNGWPRSVLVEEYPA